MRKTKRGESPLALIDAALTYDDYLALPNDGKRYEIIEGELYVSPAPSERHQTVLGNLFILLTMFVRAHRLGKVLMAPYDVVLVQAVVVQPDLVFVSQKRRKQRKSGHLQGAPDLAVEVLSPGSMALDRTTKLKAYARNGIPHYWIVDPMKETLEEHVLMGGRYRVAGKLTSRATFRPRIFEGLELDLSEVFDFSD